VRPHHNKIKIATAKTPRPCLPLVGPRPGITAAEATHTTSKKTRRLILWNGLDRLATSDRQCFTTGDRSGLNRPPTVENWLIKHFGSSNLHHCMRCRSAYSRTTCKSAHHHTHLLRCHQRPWTGRSATSWE
jgi:hypothetical protein